MSIPSVPRDKVQEAIEAGIKVTSLPERDNEALRAVGERVDFISVGEFERNSRYGCGCPATEAGLWPVPEDRRDEITGDVIRFANTFDAVLDFGDLHKYAGPVEVI